MIVLSLYDFTRRLDPQFICHFNVQLLNTQDFKYEKFYKNNEAHICTKIESIIVTTSAGMQVWNIINWQSKIHQFIRMQTHRRFLLGKNNDETDHNQLEVVRSAKLLSVIITSDLSRNEHINETVKKASKRLYFLVQLKRAKLPCRDLVLFLYATCIRSILVYAAPVFFYALPKYLQCELERVQKRALSIICPSLSYDEALQVEAGIPTIISYCEDLCDKVFITLPSATRINLTSYYLKPIRLHFTKKSPTLCTSKVEDGPFSEHFYFVIVPKVQLNDSVWMLLYIICMNF